MVSVQLEDEPSDFLSLDDFFGTKTGRPQNYRRRRAGPQCDRKSVETFERMEDPLKAWAGKKHDAVLVESLISFASPVNVGLMVKKSNQEMQVKLHPAVQAIMKDGSFKAISDHRFGYEVSRACAAHAMSN